MSIAQYLGKHKNNASFYIIIFFSMLVINPAGQFFTLYQRSLGFSLATIGAIAATGSFFDMFSRLSTGIISDRMGRRRPLLIAIIGLFIFPFGLLFFSSPIALGVLSVIKSIASAAFWTIGIAYLYDTNSHKRAGRVYSHAITSLFAVNLLSGFFGGLIVERLGFSWLFSLSCYMMIPPLVLIYFLDKPTNKKQELSIKKEVSDIIERPRFIKLWITMFLISFSSAFISNFFPLYLKESLGLTYMAVGVFYTLGTIVLALIQPLSGYLADRFKSRVIIPLNLLVMTVGFVLLSFLSGVVGIFFAKSMVPIGIFGARTKGATLIAKLLPNEEHALGQALFKSSSGFGWIITNVASAVMIQNFGYVGVFRFLALLMGLAGAGYFFSYRGKEEKKSLEKHHVFTLCDTHLWEVVSHHSMLRKKKK